MTDASAYVFEGGYPTVETIRQAFDDADLNRAVSAYRFFYPTVSIMATWKGNLDAGMVPNQVFGILEGTPEQLVFTPNSDTPYAGLVLDVRDGPMVVELPPGPLMCTANDLNQRWVIDMGLPGPDGGRAASTPSADPATGVIYRTASTRGRRPPTGCWCCCGRCPAAMTWPGPSPR